MGRAPRSVVRQRSRIQPRAVTRFKRPSAGKPRKKKFVRRLLGANASARMYSFNRGFTNTFTMGIASTANRIYLNTDSKYMVIKLAVEANRLEEFDEFNSLFSEYKIKSFSTTFTPSYSKNMARVLVPSTDAAAFVEIPNFEVIAVPARTINAADYETLTSVQIDSYLMQTQRMNKKLTPGGVLKFTTPNPSVVKSSGPIGKAATALTYTMGSPPWLSTKSGLTPDTQDVSHFGLTLLIRRVDGDTIGSATQNLEYRITTRVNLDMRKVQ